MDNCCKEANIKWDYKKYPFGFSFIFLRNGLYESAAYLSKEALKLLDFMHQNNGILENKKIACSILNRKERTVSSIICTLIKSHKIERIGSNKSGYWKVIK